MDVLYLLLVLSRLTCVVLQPCHELKLHELGHQNKRLPFIMSCLVNLSFDQCALECLLVKKCKSFNYFERKETDRWSRYSKVCELNYKDDGQEYFQNRENYVYVDIQTWPAEVAGTCAHRPCAENQRCLPTTPYRCTTIDCGDPPAVVSPNTGNVTMIHKPTQTSLGSEAFFTCVDKDKNVAVDIESDFYCFHNLYKMCNSDSSWTVTALYCSR